MTSFPRDDKFRKRAIGRLGQNGNPSRKVLGSRVPLLLKSVILSVAKDRADVGAISGI